MPLIKPEIQKVLRASGLLPKSERAESGGAEETLSDKLDRAGLSLDEVLEELSCLVKNSANEAIRKGAIETALKAHGALKEQAVAPPAFTIVIQNTQTPTSSIDTLGVNPILLPRQLQVKDKVN